MAFVTVPTVIGIKFYFHLLYVLILRPEEYETLPHPQGFEFMATYG